MKRTLTLANLAHVENGRIAEAFERELQAVINDCKDRPNLDKERKVTLTVIVSPSCDDRGNFESAEVRFGIKKDLPPRGSKPFHMIESETGGLLFNDG